MAMHKPVGFSAMERTLLILFAVFLLLNFFESRRSHAMRQTRMNA